MTVAEHRVGWTYLATAPNPLVAELWCQLLEAAGIPARVDPADVPLFPALGLGATAVRVQVPADRVEAAALILAGLEFWPAESSPELPPDAPESGPSPAPPGGG